MKDPSLNIQSSINSLVSHRSRNWTVHDQAVEHGQQLKTKFASKYPAASSTAMISPLTVNQFPQEEVVAVIHELETIDQSVSQHQTQIRADTQQIEQLKKKARNLMIGLAAFTVLSIGILILVLQNQSQSSETESSTSQLIHRSV